MKKIAIIMMGLLLVSMASVFAVPQENFCSDSDDGADIWTPGEVETEKGVELDDCDGESNNLKEGYCDAANGKFDNIKCTDFGAVCVSAEGADYCACPDGTRFDGQVCQSEQEVPEFSLIAGSLAAAGAGAAFFLMRKKA